MKVECKSLKLGRKCNKLSSRGICAWCQSRVKRMGAEPKLKQDWLRPVSRTAQRG
jgi:hypothetical protein